MTPIEARSSYTAKVADCLVGPMLGEDEQLELGKHATPADVYLTGILFADAGEPSLEDDESLDIIPAEEPEEDEDEGVSLSSVKKPSMFGLSFAVQATGERLSISVSFSGARYTPTFVESEYESHWKRNPVELKAEIELVSGLTKHVLEHGVTLHVRVRESTDILHVTVVAQNSAVPEDVSRTNLVAASIFQSDMKISAANGCEIVPRPVRRPSDDEDQRTYNLLYRDQNEWAVGHICSADWTKDGSTVQTAWLPTATVPAMSARGNPIFGKKAKEARFENALDARALAEADTDELVARLAVLPEGYEEWLEKQRDRGETLPAELQETALDNIERADRMKSAIRGCIDQLGNDHTLRRAFQLAQAAMAQQFRWAEDASLVWRPFQLAFQLLAIPGLQVNGDGSPVNVEARCTMDLLWFPTGGGKTEAYLGLTAFLFFYRRLTAAQPDDGAGVSVIMRYTLRLLTVQQFERATRLVMSCEMIRKGENLGSEPFSIGLWVGNTTTPNRLEDAQDDSGALNAKKLVSCPVCGEELPAPRISNINYEFYCSNDTCAYGDEVFPVYTIDDLIYENCPSLVIGTIDKFAQIVRNADTNALFGKGKYPPPDLIIQDELHLISGPLGTLAGVYEAAIDIICSRDEVPPKVVGSTATIRRAAEQVRDLFDRDVRQFPPPVVDANDSCFAVVDEEKPGRQYIGLSTIGRSAKFSLQATYAACLLASDERSGVLSEEVLDPYWTLVGYFNSLRELGGAVVMLYDDVGDSLSTLGRLLDLGGTRDWERANPEVLELSSRVKSEEIPNHLETLTEKYPDQPYDAVVATNMISVGVDIPRLGLMVVNGQPKGMAEYIQATSRVGRGSVAGVVYCVYNAARNRDRSHFETFKTWHDSLYSSVEPNSVTPWADRARDKALHAAIVAIARHKLGMLHDEDLQKIESCEKELERYIEQMCQRVKSHREAESLMNEAREFIRRWKTTSPDYYWNEYDQAASLLVSAETAARFEVTHGSKWQKAAKPTPNSMRTVEPTTQFRLLPREDSYV